MDEQVLTQAAQAAEFLKGQGALGPSLAVVLGSGLAGTLEALEGPQWAYSQIPGMPAPTVAGHSGVLKRTDRAFYFAGRFHFYEGHPMSRVVFPIFLMKALGVKTVILTNAAGGVRPGLVPGDLVLISDHINLLGTNPLIGPNPPGGSRFFDMTQAYDPELRARAQTAARTLWGAPVPEGVYAAMTGPSYETPAEIRYLRTLGADLVGMSTVPETIAARQQGLRVLGISCVTNLAAGMGPGTLDHQEVVEVGARVTAKMQQFLGALTADPEFQKP